MEHLHFKNAQVLLLIGVQFSAISALTNISTMNYIFKAIPEHTCSHKQRTSTCGQPAALQNGLYVLQNLLPHHILTDIISITYTLYT